MSKKITKKCYRCKKGTKKNIVGINNKWELPKLFREISPDYAIPDCSPDLKEKKPKNANLHDTIDLGEKFANRIIFYFAAHPKNIDKCDIILHGSKAYGDLSNQGVAITNSKGVAKVSVNCPQAYKEEGNTYISHIHFIVSNKKNKRWIPKMKTQTVSCNVSHKQLKKILDKNCAIVLNALAAKYYIQDRIPNSYNLPYQLLKKNEITENEVVSFIKSLLIHYPKLAKSIENKKIKLKHVPIITYCYYNKCNASDILKEKLIEMGFKNVREYKLGIQGWRKREKK